MRHLNAFCGCRKPQAAAIHEPRYLGIGEKRYLYVIDSTLEKVRYSPEIDVAAAIHEPQSRSLPCGLRFVDCGSYLQICSCRNPQSVNGLRLPQLLGWEEFNLPQHRNISLFIPSPLFFCRIVGKCGAGVYAYTLWYYVPSPNECYRRKLPRILL